MLLFENIPVAKMIFMNDANKNKTGTSNIVKLLYVCVSTGTESFKKDDLS